MKYIFLDWLFKFIKTILFKILLTMSIWFLIYLTFSYGNTEELNIWQLLGIISAPLIIIILFDDRKSCHCHGTLNIKNDTKYYTKYKCCKCATAHHHQKWWIKGYDVDTVNAQIFKSLEKHKKETQGFYYFED